jgi:hypothetical protein
MSRLKRMKRVRHDPLAPLVIVAVFGFLAYALFILRFFWG